MESDNSKTNRSTLNGNYDGLHEFYCLTEKKLRHIHVKCSQACNNGECYGEVKTPQCIDEDGGENIYVASKAGDEYGTAKMDCCINEEGACVSDSPYLSEAICKPNPRLREWVFTEKIIKYSYGCKNGACIKK